MPHMEKWIKSFTTDSVRKIATKIDMDHAALYRQMKSTTPSPATVVAIARAYEQPPIKGLLAIGFLEGRDLAMPEIKASICDAKDDELAREVKRRLAAYRKELQKDGLNLRGTIGEVKAAPTRSRTPATPGCFHTQTSQAQ